MPGTTGSDEKGPAGKEKMGQGRAARDAIERRRTEREGEDGEEKGWEGCGRKEKCLQ